MPLKEGKLNFKRRRTGIEYKKLLKGSKNFDFYLDRKTGKVYIKGNKSKELIEIGELP